jgi:hypothetical protein
LVRERLVNGNLLAIIEQLHKFEFGEHNILTYPDYDSLRELYARHCKQRLVASNEIVMLLPHYLTPASIRYALQELEIDVKKYELDQTLIIADAISTIFNPSSADFLDYLRGLENRARVKNKAGICVIADMGAFYHLRKLDELVEYERSIPTKTDLKSTLLCVYHKRDFDRLPEKERETICKSHHRELVLEYDQ